MVLPHINPGDPVASAPINDIIDVVNIFDARRIYEAAIPPTSGIAATIEWANQNLLRIPMKAGQLAIVLMTVQWSLQAAGQGPQLIATVAGGAEIGIARPGPRQVGDFGWYTQVNGVWRAPAEQEYGFGYRLTEWFGSNWTCVTGSGLRVAVI